MSLALSTHDGTSTKSLVPSTPSLRDTAVWFPEIPEPDLSYSGITAQDLRLDDFGQHQRPLSMLMFGARHGADLNHIERLTVLTQEDHGVMGLEVAQLTFIAQVYTNLGRVVELPPPDDNEWDMETRAEDEGRIISVKPDSGKVIGFLVRAVSSIAAFRGRELI